MLLALILGCVPPTGPFDTISIAVESDFEACGVADFNNDGLLDVICGDTWYEAPEWTPHEIGLIPAIGGYRVDFADVPMDVDGDGWMDVVSCSWHDRGVFWRKNPGTTPEAWKTVAIDQPGTMETAIGADIDGDGVLDFLPNCTDKTIWYRLEEKTLKRYTISETRGGHGIGVGDVNGDGRADVLGPTGWHEAPVDRRNGAWTFHPEWTLGAAGIAILVHDFNQDGLNDVFWGMGHDFGLFWLEQGTKDNQRVWTKHPVDTTWSQAHGLTLADLDGDGMQEVVTGKRKFAHNGHDPGGRDELIVCAYEFAPKAKAFNKRVLSHGGTVGAGHGPVVVDLDGDGDFDVVLPGKSGLYLLKNTTESTTGTTPTR